MSYPFKALAQSRQARWLLLDIAAGQDRVFATTDEPYGWAVLTRLGLAERSEVAPGDRARLTPAGKAAAQVLQAGTVQVVP